MRMARFVALIVALTLLTALLGRAAEPERAADPPAGQLLIASAAMPDPRFHHAVILLLRHTREGAFGIAINHPLGKRPLSALLKDDTNAGAATIDLYLGGPVEAGRGFVIHSAEYHRAETLAVADGLAMTATREVLRDIGRHQGPAKYLLAVGYAGWGAGQLEGEIARHDWFSAPADPALVFDADRDTLWRTALARRTQDL